jgi:hypothetical protein
MSFSMGRERRLFRVAHRLGNASRPGDATLPLEQVPTKGKNPFRANPGGYCERQVWGIKSGCRRQG